MQIQDGMNYIQPYPMPGMGGMPPMGPPPHWLGPPVQQPGMGGPPGLAAALGIHPGLGPMMRRARPPQQEEREMDPHRAAAMIEMGKYFQAQGKAHQAQQKLREAKGTMQSAMQMARGQQRY